MLAGGYAICWALALLAVIAPLPFGAVGPLTAAGLQVGIVAVAILWVFMRRRAGLPPLPWRDPAMLAGLALLAYGLLQIVPLPLGVVEVLSPSAASLKMLNSPALPAWTSISIDPYATWQSCLWILCWTLVAVMVRHVAVDLKGRLIVAGGLVTSGLFQAVYGLFEFISGRQHIFGYAKKYFTDVATGTFISRNNYAALLEMTIPLALALSLLSLGRSSRKRIGQQTDYTMGPDTFRLLTLLMAAFLMATALLMSRSRMGIMSMAAALVAGGLALRFRQGSRRFALVAVATVILVALFASQIDVLPLVRRFQRLPDEMGYMYGRYDVWITAIRLMGAYPLFGSGLGTWETAFSPFRGDAIQARVDFAHNDYLEFSAEAGLAGTAILFAGAVVVLWRRHRWLKVGVPQDEIALGAGLGLLALALHSFTDFHLSIPADAFAAALLVGLFLRAAGPAGSTPRLSHVPAGRSAWAPSLASGVVLLGLGAAAASPAIAQMQAGPHAAFARELPGDSDRESISLEAAAPDDDLCAGCEMEPFNAARYIDAASRARRRLLVDVKVLVDAQVREELPDVRARRYLAGRLDAALALAERGLMLSPASARGHLEAGLLRFGRFALTGLPAQSSDDFDMALASFERAMALQPWRAATHRRIARVMAPFWLECTPSQRAFIERTVSRAIETNPRLGDLKQIARQIQGQAGGERPGGP